MANQTRITAQSTAALVAAEIDRVREILDFDATTGSAVDTDMLARITALVDEKRQRAKAYILDWDEILPIPVHKSGGAKGIDYQTDKHRMQVRNWMRILLGYPALGGSRGIRRIDVGYDTYGYGCPVYEDVPQ